MILLILIISVATDFYNQANSEYESGNYFQAIELYKQALQNAKHANIYYNLGNAYFKTGQNGLAIKNYRLANFLKPRDPDIKHNLLYARTFRPDKVNIINNPLASLAERIFHYLSLFEAQTLSAIIIIISAFLIAAYVITRRRLFIYVTAGLALLVTLCFLSWAIWASDMHRQPAVITAAEISVLSGPADDYREIIKLHDGAEAYIRDERSGYYLIQLPGGIGGWTKKDAVEKIF